MFATCHLNRGARFAINGLFDEAIQEYKKALRLEPGLAEACFDQRSNHKD